MKKRKCVSLKTYLKMSTWEIISYMYIFLVSTYGCLFVYIQSWVIQESTIQIHLIPCQYINILRYFTGRPK